MYKSGGVYSRRSVELDVIHYVDDALADPDTSLCAALLVGSRVHGVRALLVRGVVGRLLERDSPDRHPVQIRGQWSDDGAIQFCVSEADVPPAPPPPGAAVRLLLVACFDLALLPAWMTDASGPHTRTLPIGPFSLFEAHEFIEARIGGPVDPVAARTLASLGGFVPHGLAVMIDECRSHGALERMNGVWGLLGDPVQLAVVPYLRAQLVTAGPPVVRSLFRFALTEPFSPEGLSAEEADVAAMLLSEGELYRRKDGRLEYTAAASGEGLRAFAPADERQRHYGTALRSGSPTVHAAAWAASAGHALRPGMLATVAERALADQHWHAVVDVAELAQDLAPCRAGEDVVALARIHLYAALAMRFVPDPGRAHLQLDRVEGLLATASPAEADDLRTRVRIIRADLLHYAHGEPDAALRALSPGLHEPTDARLGGHALLHLIYSGRHREARDILATEPDLRRHAPSGLRDRIAVAETLMLAASGSPARALREATQFASRPGDSAERRPVTEDGIRLDEELRLAYVAAALGSDGPESFPLLDRHFQRPGNEPPRPDLVTFYVAMAMWEFTRGEIDSAHRLGSLALDAVGSVDPAGMETTALALVAETSALRGDHARAVALLDRVAEVPLRSSVVIAGQVHRHLASTRMVLTLAHASESLRQTAASFVAQEQYGFAAEVLYAGVRFGRRRAARDLCAISEHLDGRLHGLRVDQASAVLAGDPVALLEVAEELQRVGLRLYSAEAAALASRMPSTPESLRRRATSRVATFLSEQPLPGHSMLRAGAGPPGEAPLTPREREVTRLIDSGLSNAEIAEHLTLSLSTVEGHITRIYRKTGGRRRAPARR